MTFREKINEMHDESLRTQKEFLLIIKQINEITAKEGAVPEELMFQREKLYTQFNKVLKLHRKLINYTGSNDIALDSEYSDSINYF